MKERNRQLLSFSPTQEIFAFFEEGIKKKEKKGMGKKGKKG